VKGRRVGIAALALTACFGHVIYPALMVLRAARRRPLEAPDAPDWPAVTAIVAAYRESAVIRQKVEDLLANGYPGELRVVVAADDRETAEAARTTEATVLAGERLGKVAALNRAAAAVDTPLILFTDANTVFAHGTIERLVRWFADESVGAVAGEKRVAGNDSEGAYWRFESHLKQLESRTGGTVGLVGEIGAIRTSDFKRIPEGVIIDDLWLALDVIEAGKRIVYEPAAVSIEDSSPSHKAEWERRTRNLAGTLDILWRRRGLLVSAPGDYPLKLWGHRVVRSSLGPLAHICLLAIAGRRFRESRPAAAFLFLHIVGGATFLRPRSAQQTSRLEALLRQVLFLQAVALGGMVRWLSRERAAQWPKPERAGTFPRPPAASS
jgi:biofilm PGA synthesis N-glycosyltransferase PgaC